MKKIFSPILLPVAALLLLLAACVQPPDYPVEPVITFSALSKNVMYQSKFGQDSVVISFDFTDGDGDLGFSDTAASIFIVDGRDEFDKPPYRIPYINEEGAGNGISGTIYIVVPTTCCIYPINSGIPPCDTSMSAPQMTDTVFYKIWIRDRAGHLSNVIETAPITLVCRRQ